jgi:hypothetical protein
MDEKKQNHSSENTTLPENLKPLPKSKPEESSHSRMLTLLERQQLRESTARSMEIMKGRFKDLA